MADAPDRPEAPATGRAECDHRGLVAQLTAALYQQVLASPNRADLLERACAELVDAFDLPFVWLGLKQPDGTIGEIHAAGTRAADCVPDLPERWETAPILVEAANRVIRLGQPQLEVLKPRVRRPRLAGEKRPGSSISAVPIQHGRETLGALVAGLDHAGAASDQAIACLQAAAERIGTALDLAALQRSVRLRAAALEVLPDPAFITDRTGRIVWVNGALSRLTGYAATELIGQTPHLLSSDQSSKRRYQQLWRSLLLTHGWRGELVNRRQDGTHYVADETIAAIADPAGRITHFVAVQHDITRQKDAGAQLHHIAFHDALTDLPNRALFRDRLALALSQAKRHGRTVALLFLDVDRFKQVNDSLGHESGDELLRQLARRIARCLRAGDTVARLGGDEFGLILPDLPGARDAALVARKLLAAVAQPFRLHDQEVAATASIGISLYPFDGSAPDDLLRNADLAMYRAKELGRNRYEYYARQLTEAAQLHQDAADRLRWAIARQELGLLYEPEIALATGEWIGVEAMVNWCPLERPALRHDVLAVAEETELSAPIGGWLLKAVCAQSREWQGHRGARLAIGAAVTSQQLYAPDFVSTVIAALTSTGLDPGQLELAIREATVMRDPDAAARIIHKLRRLGVRVAIDHFGTGYSSLSQIPTLAVTTLRIDRSFTHKLPDDPSGALVTRAAIALAQVLRLDVVAEGIERPEQAAYLYELGCRRARGTLFGEPLTAEAVASRLQSPSPELGEQMSAGDYA